MLSLSTAAVLLPSLLLAGGLATSGPPRCAVIDSIGRCLVSAVDPGRPGATAPRPQPPANPPSRRVRPQQPVGHGEVSRPKQAPPAPARTLPVGSGWARRPLGDLAQRLAQQPPQPAAPPPPAAPAPAVLAQRAIRLLDLPAPVPRTSANGNAVVGVPLWLWVDRDPAFSAPVTTTAVAGAARVTATARFSGLEWSMGPAGASVRCAGTGTPWTGQQGPSPDCGYTYRQRSLAERTAGTGRWPVVVNAVWIVTWAGFTGGAPVNGGQEIRVPVTTTLPVGEVQVLVDGDGS